MFKSNYRRGLCALLSASLAGCVGNNDFHYSKPIIGSDLLGVVPVVSGASVGSSNPAAASGYTGASAASPNYEMDDEKEHSAKIGVLDVSVPDDRESVRVKIPYLPAVELPVRRDFENSLYNSSFDYSYSAGFSNFNEFDLFASNRTHSLNYEEQSVPISFLGKIAKEIVWDSDYARPVRRVSEEISRLTDAPASYIFGAGSKSEVKFKLDSEKVGIKWLVRKGRWDFSVDYQESIRNGENFLMVSVGAAMGPSRVRRY